MTFHSLKQILIQCGVTNGYPLQHQFEFRAAVCLLEFGKIAFCKQLWPIGVCGDLMLKPHCIWTYI